MKAQSIRKFIGATAKAVVVITVLAAVTNCGALPEEEVMAFDAQPAAPTPIVTEPETQFVCAAEYEGDSVVYDNTMTNVIKPGEESSEVVLVNNSLLCEPDTPTIIVETCEGMGLVEENGTCVEPTVDPIEPTEVFNFTVTPAQYKVIATWDADERVSSFVVEITQEGKPYSNDRYPTGTSWTVSTFGCTSAYSFKLVANMVDGTTVESNPSPYLKPSNCE
tara:strand:- start:241 stop:903 length:663 start_codon:yes stop_codon:yes gene_type:complete